MPRGLMLHGDLHVSRRFRSFIQLKSALRGGRSSAARPTDVDTLDLHQAFVDLQIDLHNSLTIRMGRQEIAYGSSRLISVREGPNVRRSFDGVRLMSRLLELRVDAFALSAVATNPGIFDDGSEGGTWLWGLYGTSRATGATPSIDLYYLGLSRPRAEYEQGTERELRHSMGTRVFGDVAHVDYNIELVYQFGRFGEHRIHAWTAASDIGYTFTSVLRPRAGLRADITSGDANPLRGTLQTFNPLFPRGNYFGEASLVGPMNHRDLHPSFAVSPATHLTLTAEWLIFFRNRVSDALYRVSTAPQVPASGSRSLYVGSQVGISIAFEVGPELSLLGSYAHFFPGAFLHESGLGRQVDFAALWLTYKL